jgi:hypothetical protein
LYYATSMDHLLESAMNVYDVSDICGSILVCSHAA